MILTVFRLRLKSDPAILDAYKGWAARLNDIVLTLPGYVSHKRFLADDGERCTIVEFADQASHDAWSRHPVHLEAKHMGRSQFFETYDIKVCEVKKVLAK